MKLKEKIILILAENYCQGEYKAECQGCTASMKCVSDCQKYNDIAQKIMDMINEESDCYARRIRCSD